MSKVWEAAAEERGVDQAWEWSCDGPLVSSATILDLMS